MRSGQKGFRQPRSKSRMAVGGRALRPILLCLFAELLLCSSETQATVRSLASQNTGKILPSAMQQKGAACMAAAANLGSCLTAVSPASNLMTIEESDCCAGLLAFQQAQCYCLPAQSLDMAAKGDRWAYRRRLNALHKVHQRCGWEAFTCPGQLLSNKYLGLDVDRKASEEVFSSLKLPVWSTSSGNQEESDTDEMSWESGLSTDREVRGSQRLLGSSNNRGETSLEEKKRRKDLRVAELSEYVSAAVDLADAMSQTQDAQIEISIEMVVESEQDDPDFASLSLGHSCLYKVLFGSLPSEWLTLNFWLGLSVLILLAALVASLLQRRQSTLNASPGAQFGVVLAATEAASYSK